MKVEIKYREDQHLEQNKEVSEELLKNIGRGETK